MRKTEQEKIDFIKEHANDRPRNKLAQRAGVSVTVLYETLHKIGCEFQQKEFIPKPDTNRDKAIAELYPYHSITEIADILGCPTSTIGHAVRRLKLSHTPKTIQRLQEKVKENLKKAQELSAREKRAKSWKKTRRMEKLRVVSCIPQQTKFKFAQMPQKAYSSKYRLIRQHGYFAFEGEPYIIGYDKNTHRIDEEYYKNKYGFIFEEDELCQED